MIGWYDGMLEVHLAAPGFAYPCSACLALLRTVVLYVLCYTRWSFTCVYFPVTLCLLRFALLGGTLLRGSRFATLQASWNLADA